MLELTKKYTGVTYNLNGLESKELDEIITALQYYHKRDYYYGTSFFCPQSYLGDKLMELRANQIK